VGLCIVLVKMLRVPEYWVPLMVGVGLFLLGLIRYLARKSGERAGAVRGARRLHHGRVVGDRRRARAGVRAGGRDVALTARRVERLERLAAELVAAGRRALVAPADVTVDGDLERAVARTRAALGRSTWPSRTRASASPARSSR